MSQESDQEEYGDGEGEGVRMEDAESPPSGKKQRKEKKSKKDKKDKKDKIKWIDEADEEGLVVDAQRRRELRANLNQINEYIDEQQDNLTDLKAEDWTTTMATLNQQHKMINHTREAQVDAKIVNKLSVTMNKRAMKLDDMSRRISFQELALQVSSRLVCLWNKCLCIIHECARLHSCNSSIGLLFIYLPIYFIHQLNSNLII